MGLHFLCVRTKNAHPSGAQLSLYSLLVRSAAFLLTAYDYEPKPPHPVSHYLDYYRRTIAAHPQGLKLVLGGTGLGKTSSLAELLKSPDCPPGVKFIYVANRLQLLDEMAGQVPAPLVARQGSDVDQLRPLVADGTLAALLAEPAVAQLVEAYNEAFAGRPLELPALRKTLRRLHGWLQLDEADVPELADDQGMLGAELLRPLRHLLAYALKLATAKPRSRQPLNQKQAAELTRHPVWARLFPYYRFRTDPTQRLLLLTVQKGFHGVFTGQQTIRLGGWEPAPDGTRYVFVFDEFDFLENDILGLLARERDVSDPFGLVRTFHERMRRQKLPYTDYLGGRPEWGWVRQEIKDICDRVEELPTKHGIDFPDITHFVTHDEALKKRAIFQTNYSLIGQPVYLHDRPTRANSFELTTDRTGRPALRLLDVVSRAVKDIIRLFKRVQADHDDIYPELLRQCFGSTTYAAEISRIKQIGTRHEWSETTYGELLTNGFGLFEIEADRSPLTDSQEVAVRYLSLNRSPESIVRELARHHLVFGLSATAHIARALRNFDWRGFARPLLGDSFAPLPLTAEDAADIAQANIEKTRIRGNQLRLSVVTPLAETTKFGANLVAEADLHEEEFGKANAAKREHRLKRALHFFGLLDGLADAADTASVAPPTHLVFLSSLKQVKHLLHTYRSDNDGWFTATPTGTAGDAAFYDVRYRAAGGAEINCHVVLYDASLGRALRQRPTLGAQYDALFWTGRPVVVVTTYPSAGNGVNLQYYPTPDRDRKQDFTHLHLLDAPYFYFDGTSKEATAEENHSAIKRDVYGILKLLYAKLISEAQAKGYLGRLRELKQFNQLYRGLPDGVLNQFSVFVQALGRIERVWQPMPDQGLHLDPDVYRVFERLVSDPLLATEYAHYIEYASPTMRQLLASIETKAVADREALDDEVQSLRHADTQARAAIHELVSQLARFRATGQPADARQRWERLRTDVLKHQFRADSLVALLGAQGRPVRGVFRTDYVRAGRLLLNPEGEVAPPSALSHEFAEWNLNTVYRPLLAPGEPNTAITNYFRRRGYELAFLDAGWYFLPYVYQAILAGAIGEEAIQAILTMKKLPASAKAIPDALYEVADLRLEGRPIFIDCKNYGTQTLAHFALPPDDPRYHPKLNETRFRAQLVTKLATIAQVLTDTEPPTDEPPRLVVMNLVSDDAGTVRYYDADGTRVAGWEEARLIVLTGALKPAPTDAHDLLTDACIRLLNQLS